MINIEMIRRFQGSSGFRIYLKYSLNSLKGGYIGDYIGEYCRV